MTISQTVYIYIGLVLSPLLIFRMRTSTKCNKLKVVFFMGLIWSIMAFRKDVGSDYFNYIKMYNEISRMGLIVSLKRNWAEPLYVIFNLFIYNVFNDYNYVFIISSLMYIIGLILGIISYRKRFVFNLGLSLFVFMSRFYFPMFTTIRLSLAMVFVFINYENIIEKKPVKYIILTLVAASLHYTAIITLPLYWIVNLSESKKSWVYPLIFLSLIIVLIFFEQIAVVVLQGTKYYKYAIDHRMYNFSGGFNQLVLHFPLFLLVSMYKNKLISINNRNKKLVEVFQLGSVLMLFTLWIGILDRMLQYFLILQVILVPQILVVSKKDEKHLILFLILIYYLVRLFLQLKGSTLLPYESIF